VQHRLTFDAFGTPTVGSPAPFGFAGEMHLGGLQYLRARWYDAAAGVFVGRDPFDGFDTMPYSLHYYQYGYSDPVLNTDPTGRQCEGEGCIDDQSPPLPEFETGTFYPLTGETCELDFVPFDDLPTYPLDTGYVTGLIFNRAKFWQGSFWGSEKVYDLYTFEYGEFDTSGTLLDIDWGFEVGHYRGRVWGWSQFYPDVSHISNYEGDFQATTLSFQVPFEIFGLDVGEVVNEDETMIASTAGQSVGVGAWPSPVAGNIGFGKADFRQGSRRVFRTGDYNTPNQQDAERFAEFIRQQPSIELGGPHVRSELINILRENARAWESIRKYQSYYGLLPWGRLRTSSLWGLRLRDPERP
jgi:RHS repeat-associated protein